MEEELIEKLAELEHEQWMYWSRAVVEQVLGDSTSSSFDVYKRMLEKHQSWLEYWKPYEELSEEVKEHDRKWAYKAAKIMRENQVEEEIKEKYDAKKHSEMYP